MWKEFGLAAPPEVTAATDDYRRAENIVAQFIEERCEQGAGMAASGGALYAAYVEWCRETGEDPMTNRRFGDRLTKEGFVGRHGVRFELSGRDHAAFAAG